MIYLVNLNVRLKYMKILNIQNILIKENANYIKKWFLNISANKRKIFFKYFSERNYLNIFYLYVSENKIAKSFYFRKYNKNIFFTKDFLKNLYIMLSFNQYNVDHYTFYQFFDLNKKEIEYIDKLFYVEDDYHESRNYNVLIKGIIYHYYDIKHVNDYLNLKYQNYKSLSIYKNLKDCFDYLKYNNVDELFSIEQIKNKIQAYKMRDMYINEIIKYKFNMNKLNQLKKEFQTLLKIV